MKYGASAPSLKTSFTEKAMSGKLIFIETSDIGAKYLRQASVRLGFKPLFIFRQGNYQADTLAELSESDHLLADTRSPVDTLRVVSQLSEKPIAVMSILDTFIPLASQMGHQLATVTVDEGVAQSKDKGLVADILGAFSPATVKLSLTQSESEWAQSLTELWDRSPAGILLKLRFGAGALGLHFVSTREELASIRSTLIQEAVTGCPQSHLWLAQSRIEGELISCEGFWENGIVTPWGFTGRSKVGKTESRCYFPHDTKLTPASRAQVDQALHKLFTGLAIQSTYFHSEFIVSKDGAHLIDSNIGRIAGASVAEMIALSYDFDPVLLYAHYILTSLPALAKKNPKVAKAVGQEIGAVMNKPRRDTLALLYGAPFACFLKKLHTPPAFRSRHLQLLAEGGPVPSMGTNNWDWIGLLTGFPDDVWADYRQIQLETDKEIVSPIC